MKVIREFNTIVEWQGHTHKYVIKQVSSFEGLENVSQSYAFIFNNEEKILIVSTTGESWSLPGGTLEEGETILEALQREVYEEAAIILDENSIKPFYLNEVYELDEEGNEKFLSNQVRFVSKIKRANKFVGDPDENGVKYHKWIFIADLDRYLKWGKTIEFVKEELPGYI